MIQFLLLYSDFELTWRENVSLQSILLTADERNFGYFVEADLKHVGERKQKDKFFSNLFRNESFIWTL